MSSDTSDPRTAEVVVTPSSRDGLALSVALLGPLDVRRDGATLSVGGTKQRSVLAVLALAARPGGSRGRLLSSVWGGGPPPRPPHPIPGFASHPRKGPRD